MSAPPVEVTEPDPAATSTSNDETVSKETGDNSTPTDVEAVKNEPEVKPSNGASEVKSEKVEVKEEDVDVKTENSDNKDGAASNSKEVKSEDKEEKKPKQRTYENGMLKTSARIQDDRKSQSKYDASVLPETDDPSKIRAQVEFYFGDANLPTDRYLWDLTDGATNLPVSIEKICNFSRMKRFKPVSAVVAALRESNFLEVSGPEGAEQVKRKVPYDPKTPRSKTEARSVYVKGFGDEEPSSQFDIEAFFAPFGPTNAVRLRRTPEKLFKGSVFVEFQDEGTAQKFLELDPKPLWKGKHVLKIQSKKEYTDAKAQEIKDGKMEPAETWGPSSRGRGRGRGHRGGDFRGDRDHGRGGRHHNRDRGDGDRDPDDWKKRREDDRASGFKDDRRRNDRDRKGSRGDRRARGRGRDDRGPRDNDRNREREEKEKKGEDKAEVKEEKAEETPEKKRVREEDDAEERPAKKIDSKSEVAVES